MAANGGDVEVVDFEPDEDDLMDEDGGVDGDDPLGPPVPRLRSTITPAGVGDASGVGGGPKKTKGRGFREETSAERSSRMAGKDFDSLDSDGGPGPQRCTSPILLLILSYCFFFLFAVSVS